MRVQDILRAKGSKLVSIRYDTTIVEASRTLAREQVGMLLVVDDQHELVGLLSERDITLFLGRQEAAAARAPVSDAMSDAWAVATPEDSVTYIMQIMTEDRLRHVPVMENGRLVGVISIGDILKSRLAEKDQEAAVLRDLARFSLAAAA